MASFAGFAFEKWSCTWLRSHRRSRSALCQLHVPAISDGIEFGSALSCRRMPDLPNKGIAARCDWTRVRGSNGLQAEALKLHATLSSH